MDWWNKQSDNAKFWLGYTVLGVVFVVCYTIHCVVKTVYGVATP